MFYVEFGFQGVAQIHQDLVSIYVLSFSQHHMSAKGRPFSGYTPDVEIVHATDTVMLKDCSFNFTYLQSGWHSFHENLC